MKNLIFTIILIISFTSENKAQSTVNPLTESEFKNMAFNGIPMHAIEATNGKVQLMENLMGTPQSIEENGAVLGEKTRRFIYGESKVFVFEGLSENQNPAIVHIETNSLKIGDTSISLGDDIKVLGNKILQNRNKDGSKSIIFSKEGGDCCGVIIEYDNSTNKVSRIRYMVWT